MDTPQRSSTRRTSTAATPQAKKRTRKSAGKSTKSANPAASAARTDASNARGPNDARSLSTVMPSQITADSLNVTSRFDGASRCIALGLDRTAWTGEADGSITVRMAPLGYEIGKIEPFHSTTVSTLLKAYNKMWAGYNDGAIRVFHLDTMELLFECTKYSADVYAMVESEGYVFTAGGDWKVHVWDAEDYHHERMLAGHKNSVRCLAAYRDPESGVARIASGGDDGVVKVWDPACGSTKEAKCLATLEASGKTVWCAKVLVDTAELWVGTDDGAIFVYDLYSHSCTASIPAQRAPVVSLQQVEDTIWSGSKTNTIVIVNRLTKEVVHKTVQPTPAGAGQRAPMLLQPVQRTVVHNVWATTPDGKWQCWSCVYPEEGSRQGYMENSYQGSRSVPLETSVNSRSQPRASSRSSARRAPSSSRAVATVEPEEAEAGEREPMSPEEHARLMQQMERDAELRKTVATTRRSVVEYVHDAEPENASEAGESLGGSNRMGGSRGRSLSKAESEIAVDDEDIPIERVEKSIARDREQAMRLEAAKARSVASSARAAPVEAQPEEGMYPTQDAPAAAQPEEGMYPTEEDDVPAQQQREVPEVDASAAAAPEQAGMYPTEEDDNNDARVAELEEELRAAKRVIGVNQEEIKSLTEDLALAKEQNDQLIEEVEQSHSRGTTPRKAASEPAVEEEDDDAEYDDEL